MNTDPKHCMEPYELIRTEYCGTLVPTLHFDRKDSKFCSEIYPCLVIKKLDLDMDPDVPIRLDPDPDSVKMDPQLLGQIIRYPRMFLCYIGTFISHFISWQCYETGMIFPYQYPMVPSNIVK